MEVKSVALYLRLSQEDEAARGQLKDESNSIHSQRLLLRQYVKEHQELASIPLREFVDDGYTGTNFDRPQFQQMMAQVKAGEVGCILVKDLSRFGRNYLEVGDYLEHIFPFLGVRFVAVNDHFDSQEYVGKTTGMEVAFRNLVYQRYSQDLSEKVKSAMHLKMSKGKYVTSCPYGYRKDPADKHHMVIDPETAPIVREIFLAAIAGKKTTEIAAALNERQIPTPQMHKKTREEKRHSAPMWSHQAVLRILQNYKYTGAMVNFKVENATIRAKVQRKNRPEDWVVVEGQHEAIVTHEEFHLAGESIRKVKSPGKKKCQTQPLPCYCGHCGRRLRRTYGLDEYYSCATQLYQKNAVCSQIQWSKANLEKVLAEAFRTQLDLWEEKLSRSTGQLSGDSIGDLRRERATLERALAQLAQKNLRVYERYRAGELGKETFLSQKQQLLEQRVRKESALAGISHQLEELERKQREETQQETSLQKVLPLKELSQAQLCQEVKQWLERVTLYADGRVEIQWKLEDTFQQIGEKRKSVLERERQSDIIIAHGERLFAAGAGGFVLK